LNLQRFNNRLILDAEAILMIYADKIILNLDKKRHESESQ